MRCKLFFPTPEGGEVRAEKGRPGPRGAPLMLGAEEFQIEFMLGEQIHLSFTQFADIVNTCMFISADIDSKLRSKPAASEARVAEPGPLQAPPQSS